MVQCVNEMPRTKDKSESFYRRQIFIPFTKCYTGIERKYIKNDYLNRKDVLEYVLYKILNFRIRTHNVPFPLLPFSDTNQAALFQRTFGRMMAPMICQIHSAISSSSNNSLIQSSTFQSVLSFSYDCENHVTNVFY